VCAKVEEVVRAVRRFPRDYARVVARVARFRLLTRAERADGTVGWFKALPPRMLLLHPMLSVRVPEDDENRRGVIALAPDTSRGHVAHEFGHAVASYEDQARRQAPDDEWASELTADWYAYKWGFGRDVARDRPTRRFGHHCVGPGQKISLGERWWRVSRRFVMHPTEAPGRERR